VKSRNRLGVLPVAPASYSGACFVQWRLLRTVAPASYSGACFV